jgi:purine nucleosidase
MTTAAVLTDAWRLQRLEPAPGPVRMVLDTDTYNEVDDQFALAYALLSPEKLTVEAIYAAPFHNDRSTGPADGMARSYAEIRRVLQLMGRDDAAPVYRGATAFMAETGAPVPSAAVDDLIARGLAAPPEDPLYVVAIGAITNVASALLLEPRLAEHIVVIWLGGHALDWPHTREFNLKQDVPAARALFDSGVPLILLPCMGVTSHLLTTVAELEAYVAGQSAVGDYLTEIVRGYSKVHRGWSKVIWDVATIGYLLDPAWAPTYVTHSPVVTDQVTWSVDTSRHLIRVARWIDRDRMFTDLFNKLAQS